MPIRLPVRPAGRALPVLRMPGFPGMTHMCVALEEGLTVDRSTGSSLEAHQDACCPAQEAAVSSDAAIRPTWAAGRQPVSVPGRSSSGPGIRSVAK